MTDEEREEEREETGWKLVHADVFRPPLEYPMLFCVSQAKSSLSFSFINTFLKVLICFLFSMLYLTSIFTFFTFVFFTLLQFTFFVSFYAT